MKWSPGTLAASVVAVIVLAAGAYVVLVEPEPSYADRLEAMCASSDEQLHGSIGNYFEAVVLISALKHQKLMQLDPPGEHAAFHEELVRREQDLFDHARLAQERWVQADATGASASAAMPDFEALRAEQAELETLYRSMGIEGCSD